MAIRVMHVVEALGVGGGVEHGLANLIERMDPRLFEHVVCSVFRLGPHLERYPADRVRVICLNQTSRTQVVPLARIIREVRPQIVHSRNWGTLDSIVAARCVRVQSSIANTARKRTVGRPATARLVRRVAFGSRTGSLRVMRLRDTLLVRPGSAGQYVITTASTWEDSAGQLREQRVRRELDIRRPVLHRLCRAPEPGQRLRNHAAGSQRVRQVDGSGKC